MNKKAMTLSTIIVAVILIAFTVLIFIYFFVGPDAILKTIASWGDTIADSTIGKLKSEKLDKPKVPSERDIEDMYENILSILRAEGNGPCLIKYKPLAEDFKGFKIVLSKTEDGILAQLVNNQGQFPQIKTISGKSPCVVGEGNAANNFYKNYLGTAPCTSNCLNDYSIAEIEFQDSDNIYVNGKKRNMESENLVYKTREGNVCFFSTYDGFGTSIGCDSDEEGLDDDCMELIKKRLKFCSDTKERVLSASIESNIQKTPDAKACAPRAIITNTGDTSWEEDDKIKVLLKCTSVDLYGNKYTSVSFRAPSPSSYLNLKSGEKITLSFQASCASGEEFEIAVLQYCLDEGNNIRYDSSGTRKILECDNSDKDNKPLSLNTQKFKC